jgi:hypothetical protein
MKTTMTKTRSLFLEIILVAGLVLLVMKVDDVFYDGASLSILALLLLVLGTISAIVGYVRFVRANPSLWQMRRSARRTKQESDGQGSKGDHNNDVNRIA